MTKGIQAGKLGFRGKSGLAIGCLIALVGCAIAFGPAGSIPTEELRPKSAAPMPFDPNDPRIARLIDNTLVPLSPTKALEVNAARPLDTVKLVPARPFVLPSEADEGARRADAVQCLTQAIYYEAAVESDAGQRAVAQVVLNRTRHPLYPKTICGVVHQGSERRTGCQFTFTCDGRLLRPPSAREWQRAQGVALAALAGRVEPGVGTATHYHANYVLPYWAGSLDKVATIGTHIFYSIRGALGRPAVFSGQYLLAAEALPARSDGLVMVVPTSVDSLDPALAAGQTAVGSEPSRWRADEISLSLPGTTARDLSPIGSPLPAKRSPRADDEIGRLMIDDHAEASLLPTS